MDIKEKSGLLLSEIKEKKPLVHHMTNYVTVNDCANIVLAIGGSPVMVDALEEAYDMVPLASSLVINIGTLNSDIVKSMLKAGEKANEFGIPVVLDPVGVGITPYRKKTALNLIKNVKFSVIRGNVAEIKILCGMEASFKGVDSEETQSDDAKAIARSIAVKLDTVAAVTGATDYVSDGKRTIILNNGHKMLTNVTGTGCMTTSLIGTYIGITKDYIDAAAAGIMTMGIAGEKAFEKLPADDRGSGTFRVKLIDSVYELTGDDFAERGKAYVE